MNSVDVRNLYLAYASVYQDKNSLTEAVEVDLEEAKEEEGKSDFEKKDIRGRRFVAKTQGKKGVENYDKNPIETRGNWVGASRRRAHNAQHNEEVDIYDVVLGHLLDEGYCDNEEAAEVIMTNMSEEWLDDILDEEDKKLVVARKKSIARLNAAKNIEDIQADGDYNNSIDHSNPYKGKSGYMEIPTDYRARKRRASGR